MFLLNLEGLILIRSGFHERPEHALRIITMIRSHKINECPPSGALYLAPLIVLGVPNLSFVVSTGWTGMDL